MSKTLKALLIFLMPAVLTACWTVSPAQLDESTFDQPFDGAYYSVNDVSGPIGVYRREGKWFVPEHRVDPNEVSVPQKKFEASQFAIVFIDKFAPPPNRFALNSFDSSRQYSSKYSSDRSEKLAILVGQEKTNDGSGRQFIVPALIAGNSISECSGYGVFSESPTGPGHKDYAKFVDAVMSDATTEQKTRTIFEVAIANMMKAVEADRLRCDAETYDVVEIPRDQVRVAVAEIVPAKSAREAIEASRVAERAVRQAAAKRERLARLEADGVQTRLNDLNGYFLVTKVGIGRFDSAGTRGGASAYNVNVVRGHPNAPSGRMGRVRFFPDTQQYEYQSYSAFPNGSCAEYTDRVWSPAFEYSEQDAPGVWYQGSNYAPNRTFNPNACMAYIMTVGSCKRVRCSVRARNQPWIGSIAVVRDYDKATDLYNRMRGN